MSEIKEVSALEVLDSRGNPTVEVTITTNKATGTAIVPSGASTGRHEAWELRDGGKRFLGLGVSKAIHNVTSKIAPNLKGINCQNQSQIDLILITLDGTKNKKNLGANATLAVSLACAITAANESGLELFEYLNKLINQDKTNRKLIKNKLSLPKAFFNVINGGKHADSALSFQEFMIVPQFNKFSENLRVASEIYHELKAILGHNSHKYGKGSANVGDEGGFAPTELKTTEQALSLLVTAIHNTGYKNKVKLALDAAASEFYFKRKYKVDEKLMNTASLMQYYLKLIQKYPVISIEDPFHQEDFTAFAELAKKVRKFKVQIVTDDLTVTNTERLQKAIENKSGNCLLLKVNQIGTLTEALEAAKLAFRSGWKVMVSHRSGETEDTFIADLTVALGCGMIKAGAPGRGERTVKYNRLLRIEKMMKN